MANYMGAVRTNYFHVKDEAKFRALMAKAVGDDGDIDIWSGKVDKDGKALFGFGSYGGIIGIVNDEDDSYDRFIDGLQECVAEDDAILIFEAGHEKLRYVSGTVTVITSKEIQYINLQGAGCAKARELLGNNNWSTQCEY